MFDPLFEDELQKLINGWAQVPPQPPPPPPQPVPNSTTINRSAFQPFVEGSIRLRRERTTSFNMNKRMMEFLKRDWGRKVEMREPERQRCLKHTMNERMRREREKQLFSDLHSVLPHGTRNEKISIIQAAAAEIRKLERRKEELEKRNLGMVDFVTREGIMGEEGGGGKRTAKIRVRVENPTSGIDSLQEVLKCLKHMGLSAGSIGFELSKHELSAVIEIDNEGQIEAAEVEAVVRTTLSEVDKWLANERNLYGR